MKKLLMLSLLIITTIITGCSHTANTENTEKELHVAAAASLTDVMKDLAVVFNNEYPDINITFNFGSSGALQQAIENGGETDLFYSAGQKQMDSLEKAALLADGTRRNLLINEIVLIVPAKDGKDIQSFEDLTRSDINKIAVGGEGVPVGQYTKEIFVNMNLLDRVKDKEILATDARQVLSWVGTGEADCGVVYATDAAISPDVKTICTAPSDSHTPVIYPAAAIKDSRHYENAKKFLDFTTSDKAKPIFRKYGFEVK